MNASPSPPSGPDPSPRRSGRVGVYDRPSWLARNRVLLIGAAFAVIVGLGVMWVT